MNIALKIKAIFNRRDNKDWLKKLVEEAEKHRYNFDSLPFKIIEQKEAGFVVKVNGLFAFISFYHMPWKYPDAGYWRAVSPYLINRVFFCKIYEIKKDPLSIIINGEIPQFKSVKLDIGQEYSGLVVKISKYGVFIDAGFHFGWRCGSFLGLMHRSQIGDRKLEDFNEGDEIKVIYQGLNDMGKLLFSNDRERMGWKIGVPAELVGQTTWARVVRKTSNNAVDLLIKGIYKEPLTIDKSYPPKYKKQLKKLKNELKDGQIINCEILEVDEKHKKIKIRWLAEIDTDIEIDNSLANNLDDQAIANLINMKNELKIKN